MLFIAGKILLILAISLDSFGVGISYGLRRIKVSLVPLLTIMFCSGAMVFISMTIGLRMTSLISVEIIEIFGGSILISVGLISMCGKLISHPSKKQPHAASHQYKKHSLIHKTKLIIKVLKKSAEADIDRNGEISFQEGWLLGIVLGIDAFGVGLGAALLGYSPILTGILIAILSALFVFLGMRSGFYLARWRWTQKMSFLPPALLVGIGVFYII